MSDRKHLLAALCMVAIITLLGLHAETAELAVNGVVFVVTSFDKYDDPVVVIAGDDGEMYAVSKGGRGEELFQYENRAVKAFGSLVMDENGRKSITIYRYKLLNQKPAQ